MSFYNETLGKPIYPTPVMGVLGLMEDAEFALGSAFRNEGDSILLLDGGRTTRNRNAEETSAANFPRPNMRRQFTASSRARRRRSIWPPKSG